MARKIKTRRRTIMREDIRRPEDTGETFEDIERLVGKSPTSETSAGTPGWRGVPVAYPEAQHAAER
jgi:hypothetical protein